jgi:hypothetical protein
MALQPSLRPLIIAGEVDAPHTLDVFCERFIHAVLSQLTLFFIQWIMSVHSGDCDTLPTVPYLEHFLSAESLR